MSEKLRCLDGQPNMLIPRMYFTFDPDALMFSYCIPKSDADSARRLRHILPDLKYRKFPSNYTDALAGYAIENAAGSITVTEESAAIRAAIRFSTRPDYNTLSDNIALSGYERWCAENKSRLPFMEGNREIFKKIAELSELQYKFGVPRKNYDNTLPSAPARFSIRDVFTAFKPITVVGESFEQTLQALSQDTKTRLAQTVKANEYLDHLDPTLRKRGNIIGFHIAQYGIVSYGTDRAYTGDSQLDIKDMEADLLPYRLQTDDLYVPEEHNPGGSYWETIVMLAVGTINRLALDRVAPGLIQQ